MYITKIPRKNRNFLRSRRSWSVCRVRIGSQVLALLALLLLGDGLAAENCDTEVVSSLRTQSGAAFSVKAPVLSMGISKGTSQPRVVTDAEAALELELSATPIFHIGSMTKTFTAALVLLMRQERLLDITDPIGRWVDMPHANNITIEMLLNHTSGIPDVLDLPQHAAGDSPLDSLAHIAAADLVFTPGTRWTYSNSNYLILGILLERVSGTTYEHLLADRLLEPLGLHDTFLWGTRADPRVLAGSRLACGGTDQVACEAGLRYPVERVSDGRDWRVAWAAGGLVSTARDMSIWIDALVKGSVLDETHRTLMLTPTALSVSGLAEMGKFDGIVWRGMGLGLMQFVLNGGAEAWGHTGYIDGFSAVAAGGTGLPSVAIAVALEQANVYELLGVAVADLSACK